MSHKEFMRRLCQIISDFSKKVSEDSGPCFCGQSPISGEEIKRNMWQGSEALLHAIEAQLKKE